MSQDITATQQSVMTRDDIVSIDGNGTLVGADIEISTNGRADVLQTVLVGEQSISAYSPIVGEERVEALKAMAKRLKGASRLLKKGV